MDPDFCDPFNETNYFSICNCIVLPNIVCFRNFAFRLLKISIVEQKMIHRAENQTKHPIKKVPKRHTQSQDTNIHLHTEYCRVLLWADSAAGLRPASKSSCDCLRRCVDEWGPIAGVAGSFSFRVLLRGRRSRREDGRLDHLSMCCGCATCRPGGSMGLEEGCFWRVNYVRARKF